MRFTYQNGAQPLEGYTILHGIHRGGFGEVYYARSGGGKEVALKLLHDEDHETELRGVTQCLNLKHANLVNIFDLKTDAHGDHWIVMEYVSGSNLEDVLTAFPNGLPPMEVRDWLSGMVAGVAYLHDRGIVHRDLKPANVYRENGVVKVGDVGLSKLLDGESRRRHTQSVGTVYYMAPEVAQGKYGPEVDVYSLGVVLYEMITGKLPFAGETTAEILMKHLTTQPNLMPIPQALRPVIAHALDKDPRKRTPNVRQLELEFLRAVQSSTDPSPQNQRSSLASSDASVYQDPPDAKAFPWLPTSQENRRTNHSSHDHQNTVASSSTIRTDSILRTTFAFLIMCFVVVALSFVIFVKRSAVPIGASVTVWPRILFVISLPFVVSYLVFRIQGRQRKSQPIVQVRDSIRKIPRTPAPARTNCFTNRSFSTVQRPLEQLPELSKSIGRAGLFASILSFGLFLLMTTYFNMAVFPGPENVALFTSVSILGSWLLLMNHSMTWNQRLSRRQRLLLRMGIGALIGTVAYGLQQFLNAHIPLTAYTVTPRIYSDPTWSGYAGFFAGWFLIRGEPRELILDRTNRFSVGLTAKSVFLGLLTSLVFAFPQWYAMLWAATISTTIQLASSWSSKSQFGRER